MNELAHPPSLFRLSSLGISFCPAYPFLSSPDVRFITTRFLIFFLALPGLYTFRFLACLSALTSPPPFCSSGRCLSLRHDSPSRAYPRLRLFPADLLFVDFSFLCPASLGQFRSVLSIKVILPCTFAPTAAVCSFRSGVRRRCPPSFFLTMKMS